MLSAKLGLNQSLSNIGELFFFSPWNHITPSCPFCMTSSSGISKKMPKFQKTSRVISNLQFYLNLIALEIFTNQFFIILEWNLSVRLTTIAEAHFFRNHHSAGREDLSWHLLTRAHRAPAIHTLSAPKPPPPSACLPRKRRNECPAGLV